MGIMNQPRIAPLALLALLFLAAVAVVVHAEDGAPGVETAKGECLYCSVGVVDVMLADFQGYESYRCLTDEKQEGDNESEMSYSLNLPSSFISQNKDLLDTGLSAICIQGGTAVRTDFGSPDYVIIPPGAIIRVVPTRARHQRRLVDTTGAIRRSVLLVRVSTPNETYVDSATVLANVTFGVGGQQTHLASQFRACSAEKFTIAAADGFPNSIVDGVMELKLSSTVSGLNVRNLENTMVTMVKDVLGVSDLKTTFDNVLFCMPPGTRDQKGQNWLAYTYQFGAFSFYNNGWCSSLSAKMHEIGHSLGLKHSGMNGLMYNDVTCMMGASAGPSNGGERGPLMCFNGHKNYILGWYADKQIKLDPAANGPWLGNLIGLVDYSKAYPNEYVLVIVGNLYIQYNRATSFNYQVRQFPNKVTIVAADTATSVSMLNHTLGAKQSVQIGDYMIGVCQVVQSTSTAHAYIQLSVHLTAQASLCGAPSQRPTLRPSVSPSLTPTLSPILTPTLSPTLTPTLSPSLTPTHLPSLVPSNAARTAPVTESTADTQSPVMVLPSNFCFSGEASVQVKDVVGITRMKDLQIGDEVLTASGKYEQVYSFGHRHESIQSEYIQFLPSGLEISKEHMLMISGGRFVPASMIQIGDELESMDGVTVTVESIETVVRSGAYAPFTASGTIMVNHVKASTYIAFQESDRLMVGGWKSPLTFQWLAHMSQSPHRIIVAVLGLGSSGSEEVYTEVGMSTWISGSYAFAVWLLQQNMAIMSMVLIPAVVLGVICMVVEAIMMWFV